MNITKNQFDGIFILVVFSIINIVLADYFLSDQRWENLITYR